MPLKPHPSWITRSPLSCLHLTIHGVYHLRGSGSWEVLGMGRWVSGSFAGEAVYLTEEFRLLWHYSLSLHQLFSGPLNILLYVFPASLLPTHLSPHSLQNWLTKLFLMMESVLNNESGCVTSAQLLWGTWGRSCTPQGCSFSPVN